MRFISNSFYCLCSLGLLNSSTVLSAQVWDAHELSSQKLKQYFSFYPSAVGLDKHSNDALVVREKHTDHLGTLHTRYTQYYQGVEIFGTQVILHSYPAKEYATGRVVTHLEEDLSQMIPKKMMLNHPEDRITPLIYIDDNNKARWAYRVTSDEGYNSEGKPVRMIKIIDAETLAVFLEWDDIKTLDPVVGYGYGGNEKTGKTMYDGKQKSALAINRQPITGRCILQNDKVSIYDMRPEQSFGHQVASFHCPKENDRGGYWIGMNGDGYDVMNQAYSVWNDALYIGMVVYDVYKKGYGIEPLSSKKGLSSLAFRVHYGHEYENAFWDGVQMTFGDGGREMYPLVSLGIAAHEVSHGVTEHYSDLIYMGQSGALNESFSDMASKAAEDYARTEYHDPHINDWMIGAEVMKEASGKKALRYMDQPTQDGHSIDSVKKYIPRMDVHYSSGVYNRFFYLLATSPGWSIHQAFEVMLKANMDYWTPTSNFNQAACGVLYAATDLHYPKKEISHAFLNVGIFTENCFKKIDHSIEFS